MFLAQANIALYRWPLDDPRMSVFTEQILPVNELAERSEGFIWRFTDPWMPREEAEAPWDNPFLFFNMSVWRNLDSLQAFIRSSPHAAVMRNRAQWTLSVAGPSQALWWIDEATRPTVKDAIEALSLIAKNGDTQAAFSASSSYASPRGRKGDRFNAKPISHYKMNSNSHEGA